MSAPHPTGDDAYERGVKAGLVEQTLREHAEHLAKINGSMADVAQRLHELVLAVQRLGDQQVARDATVLATAAALRDAEETRRQQEHSRWSPVAKLFAAVGAVTAITAVVVAIVVAVA